MDHQYILTNGINLHTVTAGPPDGELVVLLHGFPEFWYGWRAQIPFLAELGYRVVAPDLRGYNLSDKPKEVADYRLDVLVADVVGLIDALGRDKAIVIGHDWGAAITWHVAGTYPDRVSRAVIMNVPHLKVMQHHLRNDREQQRRSWYIGLFQIPFLFEGVNHQFNYAPMALALVEGTAKPDTFSAEEVERYRAAWGKPRAMRSMVNYYRAVVRFRPESIGYRLKMPTMILWGAQDTALVSDMAAESLGWCDDGELHFFEEATHWIQHEETEAVNGHLERFLAAGR